MNIKDDLESFVQGQLGTVASPFLLNRALFIIQESADDKKGLTAAAERVRLIIALFIDKNLSEKVFKDLRKKIDDNE